MRKLGLVGILVGAVALSICTSASLSGQQQQAQAMPRPYGTPPPLVITAFGGKPVTYKAPRTPWGDPDLQGVWSSDDMENIGLAVAQGRGGFGRGAAAAPQTPPGQAPPLYLDDAALAARKTQVDNAAKQRDTNAES